MILQKVRAKFTFRKGIEIFAEVGGMSFDIKSLEEIAETVESEPGRILGVAWPGQGRQHPEGKALCDAGVLKSSGSIGGGYPAISGPECAAFCNEVFDYDRFEKLRTDAIRHLKMQAGDDEGGIEFFENPEDGH